MSVQAQTTPAKTPVKKARRTNDPTRGAAMKGRPCASSIPVAEITERIDPNKPLSEKALTFIKLWASGESVTSAAARAGYSDSAAYAYKLTRFPQAIAVYDRERALYEEASQMSRKKVIDGLLDGIDQAKLVGEPSSVINGWKTIGQMCGYFEPVRRTIDVNVNGSVVMQRMNGMSDADLLRVIQEGVSTELQAITHEPEDTTEFDGSEAGEPGEPE